MNSVSRVIQVATLFHPMYIATQQLQSSRYGMRLLSHDASKGLPRPARDTSYNLEVHGTTFRRLTGAKGTASD